MNVMLVLQVLFKLKGLFFPVLDLGIVVH